MTTWRDATDEDCMLCQHLHCDDGSVLGLVVRYYEDGPTYAWYRRVCSDQVMSTPIGACSTDQAAHAVERALEQEVGS